MKPIPNGGTLGDSFTAWFRRTGKRHPEDRVPIQPPSTLLYLYEWFWEIATGRPLGPEGIALPIPPSEIAAWAQLTEVRLSRMELTALLALDAAFLKISSMASTDV